MLRRSLANLRTYAANLRRLMARAAGDAAPLTRSGSGYRLVIDDSQCDTNRFQKLLRGGRDALTHNRPAAAIRHLHAARALWRGSVLEDIPGGDVIQAHRTALPTCTGKWVTGRAKPAPSSGSVRHCTGRRRCRARATWRDALVILDGLGHPDAETIRTKLSA